MFDLRQSINGLLAASQRLNLITTELQEGVIKIRPQPIENIGAKFSRIARDLATVGDKQVRIAMGGRETDLDKSIAEAIKDPLTHIVLKAVDYGVEKPDTARLGETRGRKNSSLRLSARRQRKYIEITDDGADIKGEVRPANAVERVSSVPGLGTTVRMKTPLTLAIIPR